MKQLWSPQELDSFWLLTDDEIAFCTSVYSSSRLAVALQMKYLEHEGRFPRYKGEIAASVIEFVATQLDTSPSSLTDDDWGGRTSERHRAAVRNRLGFKPSGDEDVDRLKGYPITEVAPREASRESVREYALAWYRDQRIEPPTTGHLDRFIASAINEHETAFFASISHALSIECRQALNGLFSVGDSESGSRSPLTQLKADPGRPSLDVVRRGIDKLALIDNLGLPDLPFRSLSRKALENYRQRAATEPASALKERTDVSRHALVAIYCWVRRRELIDDLRTCSVGPTGSIG